MLTKIMYSFITPEQILRVLLAGLRKTSSCWKFGIYLLPSLGSWKLRQLESEEETLRTRGKYRLKPNKYSWSDELKQLRK